MTEYQPRTSERITEILRAQDQNPRSWQQEAAAEIERLRAALRRIEALADQGIPNEATLNRIGHISGEALEHSRGTCEQGATRERAMRELAEQAQELKMGYG